ncbi:EcsC family protein [Nocardioides daphniae]|uniref:EcsC family protein n=1 Tax=Nocardioides daphniae TaxID=402297 RepID=A0A4P7U9R5_9ACTN|nr:EcsC family protein [Nocardioides daphniae]QCC76354.1 hypothetical protein E2C04_02480 [Nocardioides daphniae]GGD07638.1 hypothetical protein GCM10007231_02940 [Nocardioides daphniae]
MDNRSDMSTYETQAWSDLHVFWERKTSRRGLPPKVDHAVGAASSKAKEVASTAGGYISDHTPDVVKTAGGFVVGAALEPTVKGVLGLLELVTETVQELTNPATVIDYHRASGREVGSVADLAALDLEHLDGFTRRFSLQARAIGAVEGGAMGALTFIPVAGSVAAIGADLVVMHALSTAVATRASHAYGLDPTKESERHHLERMLTKAWVAQAPKTGAVKGANDAFKAGAGRVRWSEKFRNDHRIAAATERLLKQMGNGQHVPIQKVVAKMPAIGVVTSAGINSTVLASLAKTSVRYGQTVHLSRKYGLPMPPGLGSGPLTLPS